MVVKSLTIGDTSSSVLNLKYNSISDNGTDQSFNLNCKSSFKLNVNGTPRLAYDYLGFVMTDFGEIKSLAVFNTLNCIGDLIAPNVYTKSEVNHLVKPFCAMRVITSATGTFHKSSVITHYGQVTSVSLDRGSTGASNQGIYAFTLPTAHPSGTNYIVMATHQTSSTSTSAPLGYITCNGAQSTLFNVWIRNSANSLQDGSFYVYTTP